MRLWNYLTQGERRVLGALVVVSLAASGVSYVRKAHPEWFLGEPTFVAEPKPPLTPEEESPPPPTEPAVSPSASSERPAADSTTPPTVAPESPTTATTPLAPPTPKRSKAPLDPSHPISLNTADAATLELLPGVGPVLAERIIAYRREIGGFRSVDDLLDVQGIGAKKLAKIRPYVVP